MVNYGHKIIFFTTFNLKFEVYDNIDNLPFNCFSIGKDSIIIEYWDTKRDKKGEKTSPKNCYANPYDWKTCAFTALGCYLIIMDEIFANGTTTKL